jgi:haloacetate dehalogenase
VIWRHVAETLARSCNIIASDLRGYGDSGEPASQVDHSSYSKRAMAADLVGLMKALGHSRFAGVGHDRGARALATTYECEENQWTEVGRL